MTDLLNFFSRHNLILQNPFARRDYIRDSGGFARDAANMSSDWRNVGSDMTKAVGKTKKNDKQVYTNTR